MNPWLPVAILIACQVACLLVLAVIPLNPAEIRRAWRRIWPAKAVRIPGKFPWTQPAPLPFGTVLIDGERPVLADGKGGVIFTVSGLVPPAELGAFAFQRKRR